MSPTPEYCVQPGAYEGKEHISHIDTMVLSKNKVTLADSHSCQCIYSRYIHFEQNSTL